MGSRSSCEITWLLPPAGIAQMVREPAASVSRHDAANNTRPRARSSAVYATRKC